MNDWIVGFIALLFNFCFWFSMFGVQEWESRTGRILPRKKHNRQNPADSFLYVQDFYTNGPFGDLIGVTCMVIATAISVYHNGLSIIMLALVPLIILALIWFYEMCIGPNHKPDWGFPKPGAISWGGKVHMVFAGVQGMIIGGGVISFSLGQITVLPLILFVVGALVWGVGFIADVKTGRFTSI